MSIEEQKPKHPRLDQGPDYERGFIDGMQEQMKRSVDRAVNAMVGKEERNFCERCGKRLGNGIHTCTPPAEKQEPVCAMCKSTHGKWSWMCGRCLLIHDKQPKHERVVFPTMLRKMWSGGEVQAWLDENVNKEQA